MSQKYDFKKLEKKWRPYWQSMDLYKTGSDSQNPKYYILDFFPYPSGDGLSVGHCRNYVPTCVIARYKRMQGNNVLHPMGWDAFGLPAENYAISRGVHPSVTSRRHADTYRRQMQLIECSYDWSREFSSTDPDYYRWTQWFFLLLYQRGLAYQSVGSQWWCPTDKTILANEQVINGRCWRCNSLVTKKDLKQWYFRITDYADRLIADLDTVDWPEPIKLMQRNWIGRSEGAEVAFEIVRTSEMPASEIEEIRAFTTRPDTLFGVTFIALAPENLVVDAVTTDAQRREVADTIAAASRKTEIDRQTAASDRAGVGADDSLGAFTGAYARHPLTGSEIPIWVADYVLMEYGSGAVMGVPGHDTRDYAFAEKHGLDIREVVSIDGKEHGNDSCFTEPGIMINSAGYTDMSSQEGGRKIVADLANKGLGKQQVSYKMRDWLISRQRYWGAPIPIIHCQDCGTVAVPEEDLPVLLPDIDDFSPTGDGRSPLAKVDDWVQVRCPECDGPAQRETDTMDGFACSSWYFLRFANPQYEQGPFDPAETVYWLPVDTYVGGAEHAVMHLLYARFWTKVMYDAGLVNFVEPFSALKNQGVLHASDGQRMSKSKGNVVTPDQVVADHGADALRAYILFIGPFEGDVIWDGSGIKGIDRFLERYWNLALDYKAGNLGADVSPADEAKELHFQRQIHLTIKKVTGDLERYKFNTAVAALMEYLNFLYDYREAGIGSGLWRTALQTFTLLVCPITPFIAEEIWQELLENRGQSVHQMSWPNYDKELIQADEVTVMVQVNGRLRDKVAVPAGSDEATLQTVALAQANVKRHIGEKTIHRVIVIPDRLINLVVDQ
jgi:leucyl-tRNA synthetase